MTNSSNHLLRVKISNDHTVIGIAVLALVCAFSKYSNIVGIAVTTIEMLVLLYEFFIKRDLYRYLALFFIVTLTCMDNAVFTLGDEGGVLYSFVNMPIIRGYHTAIFACLPLLYILKRGKHGEFIKKLRYFPKLRKSIRALEIMYVWGVISFFFSFTINDNDFWSNLDFFFWVWRKNFLNITTVIALIISFSYLFITQYDRRERFKNLLYNSLIALSIASFISYGLGWSGDYADGTTLLLTQAAFYIPFLLLFPYYENKGWVVCFSCSAISILIMLFRASGLAGKWYLTLALIVIVWIAQSVVLKARLSSKRILINFIGIIVGFVGIYVFINLISGELFGGLAQTKLIQASMLIKNIGKEGWYDILPASPKIRIDEFINIFMEYVHKPYYAILGKGFGGAIIHYTNTTNWNVVGSTFSEYEITNGLYAFMHETPFSLFLISGFLGLYFLFSEIVYVVRNWMTNIWSIIGIIWLLLFFCAGSFVSLYFGLIAWVLGKTERKKHSL